MDAGSQEVWNSFNSSVHDQLNAVGPDLAMMERKELVELGGKGRYEDAKYHGKLGNLVTTSEAFEVEFGGRSRAQQTSWLRQS